MLLLNKVSHAAQQQPPLERLYKLSEEETTKHKLSNIYKKVAISNTMLTFLNHITLLTTPKGHHKKCALSFCQKKRQHWCVALRLQMMFTSTHLQATFITDQNGPALKSYVTMWAAVKIQSVFAEFSGFALSFFYVYPIVHRYFVGFPIVLPGKFSFVHSFKSVRW